jgi:hypothetical protein
MVVSRGCSDEFLKHFETVYPDKNSSYAAAMVQRMRVVVNNISESYLYVGTLELEIFRSAGISASHSTAASHDILLPCW